MKKTSFVDLEKGKKEWKKQQNNDKHVHEIERRGGTIFNEVGTPSKSYVSAAITLPDTWYAYTEYASASDCTANNDDIDYYTKMASFTCNDMTLKYNKYDAGYGCDEANFNATDDYYAEIVTDMDDDASDATFYGASYYYHTTCTGGTYSPSGDDGDDGDDEDEDSSSSSAVCFAGSEMVTLESGVSIPIADVVVGDRVLAANA